MVVQQYRSSGPMTRNNYSDNEVKYLRNVVTMEGSKITYIVFCYQVGENGTPHLQIYARSNTKLSMKA